MIFPEITSFFESLGYLGVFLALVIESGLLIGLVLPLPGESLMIASGALAATGRFNVYLLGVVCFVAAIIGDALAYATGKGLGPGLRKRANSPAVKYIKPEYIERAEKFFEKHGGKSIMFARFVPSVRILVPVLAGATGMPYRQFVLYNVAGAIIWVIVCIGVGYYFGQRIPNVEKYILPALLVVILGAAIIGTASAWIHKWWQRRKRSR